MVTGILFALLIPAALAIRYPGAVIAGRQEDNNCECRQEEWEDPVIWKGVQPSNMIEKLCNDWPGDPGACSEQSFGDVCVGSESRTTCECVVQEASKLEVRDMDVTNDWSLVSNTPSPRSTCCFLRDITIVWI
jgi:hypothetical protein